MVAPCCSRCAAPVAGCWDGAPVLRAWKRSRHPSRHRCPVLTRSLCCSPILGSGVSSSMRSSTAARGRSPCGWGTRSRSPTWSRPRRGRSTPSRGHRRQRLIDELADSTRPRRWHELPPGRCGYVPRGCCGGSDQGRSQAPDAQRGWRGPVSRDVRVLQAAGYCSSTTCSRPGPPCGRRPRRWRVPVPLRCMWQRVHDGVVTPSSRVPNMALPLS